MFFLAKFSYLDATYIFTIIVIPKCFHACSPSIKYACQEAGGKVTDYKGNPVDITGNSDIVAGSQTIGEILVEKYL